MYLFFTAILYRSGNYLISISLTCKFHKGEDCVPSCSPLYPQIMYPQNLAQCLTESGCHRKNKGREEVRHSTSSSHSKVKFPILCLMSEKKQIRYIRWNFPTYVSLVGAYICKNVLTVNIQAPALMLSIEEDSHGAEERASSVHVK